MRILAFYPYIPYPMDRGAYLRGFHLLRGLAREHDVDLLALSENNEGLPHRARFAEFCHRVELVPFQHPAWQRFFPRRLCNVVPATAAHWTLPQAAQTLERLMATERYDAVHVFDIILAQYLLRGHPEVRLVADRTRVDLQYQLMEARRMRFGAKARLLNAENLLKLYLYERRVARRTCLQVVCGPDDERFLRRFIRPALQTAVIPNGVDTDFFHPGAAPEEARAVAPTVLFCGAMDYNPNIDALRWYFAQIHDRLRALVPGLQLLIVGKNPGTEVKSYQSKPDVIVTGAVPDVRPYYRRAWLQIVPLRIGGGTRLKIVESMAMGTSVLSTTIGAQGLGFEHDREILLADSAHEFVRNAGRALADPALRERLETAAWAATRARLSWPMLGRQLSDTYTRLFGSGPGGPPAGVNGRSAASAGGFVSARHSEHR